MCNDLKWIDTIINEMNLSYEQKALMKAMKKYIVNQEKILRIEKSKLDGQLWQSKKV